MNKQPFLILSPSNPLPSHLLSLGLCRAPCVSPCNIFLPSCLVLSSPCTSSLSSSLCFLFSLIPSSFLCLSPISSALRRRRGLLPCRLSAVILKCGDSVHAYECSCVCAHARLSAEDWMFLAALEHGMLSPPARTL